MQPNPHQADATIQRRQHCHAAEYSRSEPSSGRLFLCPKVADAKAWTDQFRVPQQQKSGSVARAALHRPSGVR